MIDYQAVITGNGHLILETVGVAFPEEFISDAADTIGAPLPDILRGGVMTSYLDWRLGELRGLAKRVGGGVCAYNITQLTHLDSENGERDPNARNALVTATFPKKDAVIEFHKLLLSCGYNIRGTKQTELAGVL
ncbi:hypothetical protein CMI37_09280 [Candidatus Pacearchaeota archaeon]|nr:hypothetical protein [Candidatus Pacearchaeota archaeon]|tara:strand:+ start:4127 stop:4528 length:402 start_codon:yes stop_codon:yes gene_type:complete